MPDKDIFVLKIVWRKSIASLHRLTQAVQRANLRRTAGDPTWVNGTIAWVLFFFSCVDIQISWFWCHYHWSCTLFQSISKHCNECFCCAFELYFLSNSYLLIFKLAFSPFFQCCFIKYQLNLRFQDFFLIVLSGLYFFNVLILFPCCPIYLVSLWWKLWYLEISVEKSVFY